MARGKTSRIKTEKEALDSLVSSLRSAAVRPNIYGYKPHNKQIQFHQSKAKGRLFLGGNRAGKTVAGACESVWYATGKHPYKRVPEAPVRGRVVSVDFLQGVEKIVKPEIARWCPLSELRGNSWSSAFDRELRTLYFENGSFIEFMSWEQDLEKFAGTSRHFVWYDEEPPKSIFTENKMRLLDTNGDWWITETPVDGMTWVYDAIYLAAKLDPNLEVFVVDMTENPYLGSAERDAFLSGLDEDEIEARVHGKFIQIGGLIYDRTFSKANVIPPIDLTLIRNDMWIAGMDHGFTNPTAFLWAAINSDGRIIIFEEYYKSGLIVADNAAAVLEINQKMNIGVGPGKKELSYYVGDPSIRNVDPITGTSVQLEYQEHGVSIVPGNNDVKAGIQRVARFLRGIQVPDLKEEKSFKYIPKLYITSNCTNLLRELPRYRWATWASKKMRDDRNPKEEPHKKDDHAADALRYLVSSRPENELEDLPAALGSMGYPEASSPYTDSIDEELAKPRNREFVDSLLGSDF